MSSNIKSSVQRIQQAKKSITDAIEAKGVSVPSGTKIDGMPSLIEQIESGGIDTSDATATADDIAYGKTAYTANGKEAGTLNKTSRLASTKTSVTATRKTPTVGSAYYIVEVSADELTAPSSSGRYIIDAAKLNVSMDVNASVFGDAAAANVLNGKTFTSSAGLKVAGTHVCKKPSLQSKSVTPSANSQTVQPDSGYDGLSSVAVAGDGNLLPQNIVKDVSIFGVTGTHECPAPKLHEKQITPTAAAQIYYPDTGYDGISKISVVGDPDLSPENVVYGKQIFDVVGSHKCPTFQTQTKSVTPTAEAQTVTPDANYDGLSSVSVAGDANLVPANIKKDTKIFGVTGTLETESGGIDTSDATATASDIAKDKTAYVNGEKIVGSLSSYPSFTQPEVDYWITEGTISVKYIRMRGSPTADGVVRTTQTYAMSVSASKFGDATAADVAKGKTFTSANGLKLEGTYEPASTEPKLQSKSVTPSANSQTVTADTEYDGLSSVTVAGDANLKAENIVKDVSIFGVTGTHTCKQPSLQAKSVTPSAASKTVTADSGYDGLSQVTVSGDSNLIAENIKKGVSIFGVAGTHETTATGGSSDNNCEAYVIDAANPTVTFKTSGTIRVYGYCTTTSSSGWGGSTTTLLAFCGDGYYTSKSYGSPTKTSCTFGVSGGKLTGLPTLNAGTLIAVIGV